jgi:beta-glucanase (GH16 family)
MISTWIAFLCLIFSCENKSDIAQPTPVAASLPDNFTFESTPAWADEFDYTGKPDGLKWGYDIGGTGWGNNELQYYTDDIKNAAVADGLLTITAIREQTAGREYSSARLVSKNKGDFLYGRIEVKAKLPSGRYLVKNRLRKVNRIGDMSFVVNGVNEWVLSAWILIFLMR